MVEALKVGVVGVGHLGKEHARIYRELAESELVGISDSDPAKQEKARELGTHYYQNPLELIGKVEAVSIA
ncbi:MAG TPA: Gfo/Idh/MocA family oxidoreductase, partial [Candidatus Omnitrophota bacterium]|nr:Gfo/Idh/MocA family oxidoreductase [Candidatus Omnitrophota bacterium]